MLFTTLMKQTKLAFATYDIKEPSALFFCFGLWLFYDVNTIFKELFFKIRSFLTSF